MLLPQPSLDNQESRITTDELGVTKSPPVVSNRTEIRLLSTYSKGETTFQQHPDTENSYLVRHVKLAPSISFAKNNLTFHNPFDGKVTVSDGASMRTYSMHS
jgi:hypothetical protein